MIFMHLNSILDSDVLEKTSKMSEKDLVEKVGVSRTFNRKHLAKT